MTDEQEIPRLRTNDITKPRAFSLSPDSGARAALAENLGILGIRKLTFSGEIGPEGEKDVRLTAQLGATVVQACVVTLEPVATRIDEHVSRLFAAQMLETPEGDEIEMPEDDTVEPLPRVIDLADIMAEALALAIPPWPRAEGIDAMNLSVTEVGKTPMTDDDAKPFAGLASLRDKLGDEGGTDD